MAGQAPDPQRAEAFLDFLIQPGWNHGMPLQLLEIVGIHPMRFAKIIPERLMRLPVSLDEYLLDRTRDEPRYSITTPKNWRPSEPPASRLLIVASQLGRELAEPILRDFFDRVQPLVVVARERVWASEDAWRAAGKPKRGPDAREPWDIWATINGARGKTIAVAQKFESPIFIDDVLAMLTSDSVATRDAGASMASYVLHFASARPDAVQKLREAVAALAQSSNNTDIFASQSIQRELLNAESKK